MSDDLKNIIEAVLLVSDSPVSIARIQGLFEEETRPESTDVHAAITELQDDCVERGVELKKIGGGFRYQTREKYADYLRALYAVKPPRMSRALLETLAIIAFRQPVSRGDIEEVRGVAVSSEIMQRLVEREWVKQVGVRDVPGRPALYGTTNEFLSYFSLSSLKELPELMQERDLFEIAGEMETPLPPEVLAALQSNDQNDSDLDDIEADDVEADDLEPDDLEPDGDEQAGAVETDGEKQSADDSDEMPETDSPADDEAELPDQERDNAEQASVEREDELVDGPNTTR